MLQIFSIIFVFCVMIVMRDDMCTAYIVSNNKYIIVMLLSNHVHFCSCTHHDVFVCVAP